MHAAQISNSIDFVLGSLISQKVSKWRLQVSIMTAFLGGVPRGFNRKSCLQMEAPGLNSEGVITPQAQGFAVASAFDFGRSRSCPLKIERLSI